MLDPRKVLYCFIFIILYRIKRQNNGTKIKLLAYPKLLFYFFLRYIYTFKVYAVDFWNDLTGNIITEDSGSNCGENVEYAVCNSGGEERISVL